MSDPKERLQLLASAAADIVAEMTRVAHENKIVSIPFLKGSLQFGVEFDYPFAKAAPDSVRALNGYYPAKGGALMTDGYEWRASHFECFPGSMEREWLFGEEPWPKTDYEED